ncbi:MAG: TIGR03546 family protein [Calditrichia bacterium]|nr:TIGR03546 family protein [Calditrichia bacterium]
MFFLTILKKIIKILRSQGTPNQIAIGFVLGMMMALIPLWTAQHLLFILILIIFNLSIGSFMLSFLIFKTIAYIFDPLFHSIGYWFLVEQEGLHSLWVSLYNLPVIPYTSFNNTVSFGGMLFSIILAIPVFYAIRWLIANYREKIDPKIEKLKIVKIIKSSKIYNIYSSVKNWRDS